MWPLKFQIYNYNKGILINYGSPIKVELEIIDLCVVNESEIVLLCEEIKLFSCTYNLIFFDLNTKEQIKKLDVGGYTIYWSLCLINEKVILFRDKKLLLIDVKNREIQDKIELTKVLKNANYSPKLLPLND